MLLHFRPSNPDEMLETVQDFSDSFVAENEIPQSIIKLLAVAEHKKEKDPEDRPVNLALENPYFTNTPEYFRLYYLHMRLKHKISSQEQYATKTIAEKAELFIATLIYGHGIEDVLESYSFKHQDSFPEISEEYRWIPIFLDAMNIAQPEQQLDFFRFIVKKYTLSDYQLLHMELYFRKVFFEQFPEKAHEYLDIIYSESLPLVYYGLQGVSFIPEEVDRDFHPESETIGKCFLSRVKVPEVSAAILDATREKNNSQFYPECSLSVLMGFRLYPVLSVFEKADELQESVRMMIDISNKLSGNNEAVCHEGFLDLFPKLVKAFRPQDKKAVDSCITFSGIIIERKLEEIFDKFFYEGKTADFPRFLAAYEVGMRRYSNIPFEQDQFSGISSLLNQSSTASIIEFMDSHGYFHSVSFYHWKRCGSADMPAYEMAKAGDIPGDSSEFLLGKKGGVFLHASREQVQRAEKIKGYFKRLAQEHPFLVCYRELENAMHTSFAITDAFISDTNLSYKAFRRLIYQSIMFSKREDKHPLHWENLNTFSLFFRGANLYEIRQHELDSAAWHFKKYIRFVKGKTKYLLRKVFLVRSTVARINETTCLRKKESEQVAEMASNLVIEYDEHQEKEGADVPELKRELDYHSFFHDRTEAQKEKLSTENEISNLDQRITRLRNLSANLQRLFAEPEFHRFSGRIPPLTGWLTDLSMFAIADLDYVEFRQRMMDIIFTTCVSSPLATVNLRLLGREFLGEQVLISPRLQVLEQNNIAHFRAFYKKLSEILQDFGVMEVPSISKEFLILYKHGKDAPEEIIRRNFIKAIMFTGENDLLSDRNIAYMMYLFSGSNGETFPAYCCRNIPPMRDLLPETKKLLMAFTGISDKDIDHKYIKRGNADFPEVPEAFREKQHFELIPLAEIKLSDREKGICQTVHREYILPIMNTTTSIADSILDENAVRSLDGLFDQVTEELETAALHIQKFVTPEIAGYEEKQEKLNITRRLIAINEKTSLDANSDNLWEIIVWAVASNAGINAVKPVIAKAVISLVFSLRRFSHFRDDFLDEVESASNIHALLDFFEEVIHDVCEMIASEASDLPVPPELRKHEIKKDELAAKLKEIVLSRLKIPILQEAVANHQKKSKSMSQEKTPVEMWGQKTLTEVFIDKMLKLCVEFQEELDKPNFIPLIMVHGETKEYLGHVFLLGFEFQGKKYLLISDINFIKAYRGKRLRGNYDAGSAYTSIVSKIQKAAKKEGYEQVFQTMQKTAISNENTLRRQILRIINGSEALQISDLRDIPGVELPEGITFEDGETTNLPFPEINMLPIVPIVINDEKVAA